MSGAPLGAALTTAPEAVRPAVGDGCLACAEALLAEGQRNEAAAMYERVGKADCAILGNLV